MMENFSGKTVVSVCQDFYAAVYLAGLAAACAENADKHISAHDEEKQLKYSRKSSQNRTIAKLREQFWIILLEPSDAFRPPLLERLCLDIAFRRSPSGQAVRPCINRLGLKDSLSPRKLFYPTQTLVIQKLVEGSKDQGLAGVEFLVTDSTPQSIEIKSGQVQTLTFYNTPVGGLELIKVSESDKSQRIKGVTFEIREMDGGLVDTITTGDNGRVFLPMDTGDYYAVEIEAAEGFKIDSTPHYFTIQDGKTTTLTVTNAPFSGIIIHKVDSVTGDGIYGVKFLVYDQNKNLIGEYSTDNEGYIYIDDLTVQGKGKLFIRELEAAPGYELDKEYKTVYVQPGKTIEIEWQNTPITGQFQIHKFAAEYNEVTGTPAGAPLQGAVYEISEARSGKVVDYITTDARDVAASKPLPLGRYKIVEVTGPGYGVHHWDI
jgi:hypothetical protein